MAGEQTVAEELLRKEMNRLNRILKNLTKTGTELNDKQLNIISQMQKNYTTMQTSNNQLLKTIQIGKNWAHRENENIKLMKKREKLSKQEFQQRESLQHQYSENIMSHIKLKHVMGKSSDQFAFFTNSLTKGLSFSGAIGIATEKLREMTQAVMLHKEAAEKRAKFDADVKSGKLKSGTPEFKTALQDVNSSEKAAGAVPNPADRKGLMGMLGKKLGKIGEFASKHKGGMLLGAGAGGLILGVIIKALSVAPMFQQMMKLFKFTVSLILMPIGTFFGAVLRPILISMIRGIAPNFKDWMKTSMALGDKVGKGLIQLFTDPASWFATAIGDLFSFDFFPTAEAETPEEKEIKQEEHDKYWKGVGKQMDDMWKEFVRPILTFVGYLNSFFYVILPDAFAGLTTILTDGLNWIGTELLSPLWAFIGTLNTLFFVQLPEFVGSIGERFGEFWEGVFESVRNFIYSIPVIGEIIEGYFEKSKSNLKDSPKDALDTAKAVEGIAKTFDGAWKWISNALRMVGGQTYTTPTGGKKPTKNAKIAMGALSNMSGGGIDSSGSPSYGSAAYHYSFLNPVKMAKGGIITEPIMGIGKSGQSYLMGESGNEMVTPMNQVRNGNVNININIGKVERNADFNQLKPMIQRWILEANSRRGMI